MLNIYLVRHGQNVDNANGILNGHRNEPLTDIGIGQANEVANKIDSNGLKFDTIYTSPLIRAKQTADIIADITNSLVPVVLPSLIERDFGVMTGARQDIIEQICYPDILKTDTVTYFLSPKAAETFPDLLKRAEKVLEFVAGRHNNGDVLLVTHGDFGKMIYAKYYELDWKDVLESFHFGNSDLLLLSPNSPAAETHIFKIFQKNL